MAKKGKNGFDSGYIHVHGARVHNLKDI